MQNEDKYIGILNINDNFLIELTKKAEKRDSLFIHLDRSLPMIYKPA